MATQHIFYRASDDDAVLPGMCWAETRETAELYRLNPGFGGARLWQAELAIDSAEVLDLAELGTREALDRLIEVVGRDPGAIGPDEWIPRVAEELAAGGWAWARVRESYPQGTVTWIWLAPEDRWDVDDAIVPADPV